MWRDMLEEVLMVLLKWSVSTFFTLYIPKHSDDLIKSFLTLNGDWLLEDSNQL